MSSTDGGHVAEPDADRWRLPRPDAPGDHYAQAASTVKTALAGHSYEELVDMLAELARRAARHAGPGLAKLEAALQAEMAERRIQHEIDETAGTAERPAPQRRRLLRVLSDRTSTPTELAESLGTSTSVVSRLLSELKTEGHVVEVTDPTDRRRRIYGLTDAGATEVSRLIAFGPIEGAAEPDHSLDESQLADALARAVEDRRVRNDLARAATTCERVVAQAAKAGTHDLELRARRELLATYRQARRHIDMVDHIDVLRQIWLGRTDLPKALQTPAQAHLNYELGRLNDAPGGGTLDERASRLTTAAQLYADLAEAGEPASENWTERHAWALVGLAENRRERGELGVALSAVERGYGLFEKIEDDYGMTRCCFLAGFSLRLRGHFPYAWTALTVAEDRAKAHGFARFHADTLMQMGEVMRCLRETKTAHELLGEALGRADSLDMHVTKAFALSALGATHFDDDEYGHARENLEEAQRIFEEQGHPEGIALNLRRLAVVERTIAELDNRADALVSSRLLLRARDRYQELRSPAGVAACHIGEGRLALVRDEDPARQCSALVAMLDRAQDRSLIELDPWVPGLLLSFAEDAQNSALADHASLVAESAKRRQIEAQIKLRLADPGEVRTDVIDPAENNDEMAGEPRRNASKLAA